MGATKFPVLDKDFTIKMLGVCKDDEERGLITVLDLTGMHVSVVSGLDYIAVSEKTKKKHHIFQAPLDSSNLLKQGDRYIIRWKRPKTQKTLERYIPKDKVELITAFLNMKKKSRRWYFTMVKSIGERAGYEGISPMTFRHNQCIKALESGSSIWEVPHIMGCTLNVAARNYSKKRELEQLRE